MNWHLLTVVAWCFQTNATTANTVGGRLKVVLHDPTFRATFRATALR